MRKYIGKAVLIILVIATGVAAGLGSNYLKSFEQVKATVGPGIKANIYHAKIDHDYGEVTYDADSAPLYALTESKTIRLKEGYYAAVVEDPAQQYQDTVTGFEVHNTQKKVDIQPRLSDQKLASLLPGIRPNIIQALYARYPTLPINYVIGKDKLFEQGEWYGALLNPKNPETDTLRVIMQKQNNTWTVATDPPEIIIGKPAYRSIPRGVIEGVDAL